ncbi:hypothetical protein BDR05DRAFT_747437 [Suillus weaverae]|nr:hypothetical protein BDR05DRAFT_747437 [Suillus weaverae]
MSSPTKSTDGWMSIRFIFPYTCVALVINIFVSLLTIVRPGLHHRHRILKILGPGHSTIHTSFSIESASICSLLYLIPFAVDGPRPALRCIFTDTGRGADRRLTP